MRLLLIPHEMDSGSLGDSLSVGSGLAGQLGFCPTRALAFEQRVQGSGTYRLLCS